MGGHMGFEGLDPRIRELVDRLRREYRLEASPAEKAIKRFPGWGKERDPEARIRAFITNLEQLTPGDYIFIEHPGLNTPELESVGHKGYEEVAADRDAVTKVFTSPEVIETIRKKAIKLVSYADLKR
jgi:hypothetical protein